MTRPPCHDCDENRDHCGQCGCCGDPMKLPPAAQVPAQPDAPPAQPMQPPTWGNDRNPPTLTIALDNRAAPAPDGNAGEANVYETAARFTLAGLGERNPTGIMLAAWSGDRAFRAGVDATRALSAAELADAHRKVEALLLGDKALSSRIWLAEEVARLKTELAEARAKTDGGAGPAP